MTSVEPRASRGRPRNKTSHAQVIKAVNDLLRHTSYTALTIEAIAAEAGVGKQTIYRWWSNKAEVVLEAMLTTEPTFSFASMPYTGNLRNDLLHWIEATLKEALREDTVTMVRSLMSAALNSVPETFNLLRAGTIWRASVVSKRLEYAVEQGEISQTAPINTAVSALTDPLVFRMITGIAPDPGWSQELADLVVHGLEAPGNIAHSS